MGKPSEWQVAVKTELYKRNMSYDQLAKEINTKGGYIRQLMCTNYGWISEDAPVKKRITEFLGIKV